jgi:hypothetical protein
VDEADEGADGELVYEENGTMSASGVKLSFRKGYVWRFRFGGGFGGSMGGAIAGVADAEGNGDEGVDANAKMNADGGGGKDGGDEGRVGGDGSGDADEVNGGVSLWFIKPGSDDNDVDYLFHTLSFSHSGLPRPAEGEPDANADAGIWVVKAKGSHLCVQDMYETEYSFHLRRSRGGGEGGTKGPDVKGFRDGSRPQRTVIGKEQGTWEVDWWEVRHTVRGPRKDQRIWSVYTRNEEAT